MAVNPIDYAAQLQQMQMPQADFAQRPNFIQGLSGALFPTPPGADPQTAAAMQQQALLAMGLGIMGAGSRPGATLGSSLLEGYQGASQTYAGAMNNAFRNQLYKNEQERQQKQEERQQKEAETKARQQAGTVASRVASGIGGASDPMAYWRLVEGNPDVQSAMQQFGVAPPQTPEEVLQLGQRMGSAGQLSGPASQLDYTSAQREYALARTQGYAGSFMDYMREMKGGGPPASFEEFTLAQADPEFRKFLQDRRGKGMSMTLPDGTVVQIGGDGSGVGPDELTKPTVNKLQGTIVSSTDRLDRLNTALGQYNPEFLRIGGIAKAWTTRMKDFGGLDVSETDRQFLQNAAAFQSQIKNDLSLYLNELSGAAISEHELTRLKKSAPSGDELSPAEFESKARQTVKGLTRAIMRANWALKNGIGVESVQDLSKAMPLESIDAVYEQRANEIWQELGGTPETKAEAIRRANQEFGVAR